MFLPFWPLGPIENQLKSGGLLARQSENRAGRLFSIQFNGSGGGNSQTVPLSTGHSGESLFASEEWIELHRSEQKLVRKISSSAAVSDVGPRRHKLPPKVNENWH
jgi:hypothetical protein